MTKPHLQVVVGIVLNAAGEVLIGQRVKHDAYYAKWEFPGGKLEADETAEEALRREFAEEVGIRVLQSHQFMTWEHSYPDRTVTLNVRLIDSYEGQPYAREGQALKWVSLDEIAHLDFLAGNQAIIEKLKVFVSGQRA